MLTSVNKLDPIHLDGSARKKEMFQGEKNRTNKRTTIKIDAKKQTNNDCFRDKQ